MKDKYIPPEMVARIKAAHDIVDIIGRDIPLRRSGGNFTAPCPFCADGDPKKQKLTVSPSRQSFKCWKCGESGDVFKWRMLRQNVRFPDAVRDLAAAAGISLS